MLALSHCALPALHQVSILHCVRPSTTCVRACSEAFMKVSKYANHPWHFLHGLSQCWPAKVIKLQDAGYRCRMTNVEVASCWREFAAENVHCERITVKMQQILSNVSDVKLEKQNLQEDCLPQAGMLRLPWMMRSSCALCIVLKLLQGTYIKSREQECCQGLSWIKFILMPQFDREWTRAGRLRGFSLAFTYACGVR